MREDGLNFVIRDSCPRDIPRLYEIDRECFEPGIAYTRGELMFYLQQPGSIAKVAEAGGEVLGFAIGRVEDRDAGHVITLDVVQAARRRRVGTSLMLCLHDVFRRQRAALSILEVDVRNAPAHRFYEALGYRQVETLRGYYSGRHDAHRMVCFIHPALNRIRP